MTDAQEQEMQTLRDAHMKEMTKLRYELEQARTEGQQTCTLCLGHLRPASYADAIV